VLLRAQGMPELRVTRDTWEMIIDTVRDYAGDKNIPVWACVSQYYDLCVPSIVSERSQFIWQMYHDLDGFEHETLESYMKMPALLVDAFHVIKGEIVRIENIRNKAVRDGGAHGR
jgi:hypothetical protein